MKKTYQKPQIVFESFELSQNIAGGCAFTSNNADEFTCSVSVPWPGGSIQVFSSSDVCEETNSGVFDRVCYHVPSDFNNAFSS